MGLIRLIRIWSTEWDLIDWDLIDWLGSDQLNETWLTETWLTDYDLINWMRHDWLIRIWLTEWDTIDWLRSDWLIDWLGCDWLIGTWLTDWDLINWMRHFWVCLPAHSLCNSSWWPYGQSALYCHSRPLVKVGCVLLLPYLLVCRWSVVCVVMLLLYVKVMISPLITLSFLFPCHLCRPWPHFTVVCNRKQLTNNLSETLWTLFQVENRPVVCAIFAKVWFYGTKNSVSASNSLQTENPIKGASPNNH